MGQLVVRAIVYVKEIALLKAGYHRFQYSMLAREASRRHRLRCLHHQRLAWVAL